MGAYLSSPALEKKSQDFEDIENYQCGVSGMQGWRISMEVMSFCHIMRSLMLTKWTASKDFVYIG